MKVVIAFHSIHILSRKLQMKCSNTLFKIQVVPKGSTEMAEVLPKTICF